MNSVIRSEEQKWCEKILEQIINKVRCESVRLGDKIPYLSRAGVYVQDMNEEDIAWWTNGFWGGILWQMYSVTGEKLFLRKARTLEKQFDRAMEE